MKRIKILSFCCIAVFMLTACGEKKITVKGTDGTEYESYQECCAAQDFQAAHQFLAKLQNSEERRFELNEAKEYVFKQEALYLMSIGDEAAKKRIIYLLKEEGDNNTRVKMLIDLAIENDDEEFVKTLVNQLTSMKVQYTASNGNDQLYAAVDYLINKDIQGNLDLVCKLIGKVGVTYKDKELISLLVSKNNKELSDEIVGLVAKMEIKGTRVPKGQHDGWERRSDSQYYRGDYFSYINSTNEYNKACDQILEVSINQGNEYIAQKILRMYKEDVFRLDGGSGIKAPDGTKVSDGFYIYYTNDSKNNAQKRYKEAKMNGAFKK
jgi:hypothetical protein